MIKFKDRNTTISWIILCGLVLVWGSSFILMKRGMQVFSSSEVASLRITSAFLFLLPFTIRHFKNIPKDKWIYIIISGFIGYFIPAFLFTKAQTHISSSITGILNSVTPLFTLLIGIFFYNFKSKWYNVAGVLIGLAGAVGLLYHSSTGHLTIDFEYGSLVIIATVLYSININLIKNNLKNIHSTSLTVFMFIVIGPFAILNLFLNTDFVMHMTVNPRAYEGLGYVLFLGIVGSALATIVFNYLIKITSILFAASVTYLMPVIAIMWGILDGESFKMIYLFFLLMILSGVYLVNFKYKYREIPKIH